MPDFRRKNNKKLSHSLIMPHATQVKYMQSHIQTSAKLTNKARNMKVKILMIYIYLLSYESMHNIAHALVCGYVH